MGLPQEAWKSDVARGSRYADRYPRLRFRPRRHRDRGLQAPCPRYGERPGRPLCTLLPLQDHPARRRQPRICELVEYCLEGIEVKSAWTGPAALSLMPHALAPVAELPVLEVVAAVHTVADLTLGLGRDPPLRESRAWAGADGYVDYAGGHADQHQGVPPSRRIRQLRRRSGAAGALDRDGE